MRDCKSAFLDLCSYLKLWETNTILLETQNQVTNEYYVPTNILGDREKYIDAVVPLKVYMQLTYSNLVYYYGVLDKMKYPNGPEKVQFNT